MPCPTPLRTRLAAGALTALAAAGAGGCGAGEPVDVAAGGRVAIALDEYFMRPQSLRAAAGRVEFTLSNRGRLAHRFQVRVGARKIIDAPTLMPGASGRVAVTLPRGRYRLACAIGNHEELGMYGSLVVR